MSELELLKQAKSYSKIDANISYENFKTSRPKFCFHTTSSEQMLKRLPKDWTRVFNLEANTIALQDWVYGKRPEGFWKQVKKIIRVHKWRKVGKLEYDQPNNHSDYQENFCPLISGLVTNFPKISRLDMPMNIHEGWTGTTKFADQAVVRGGFLLGQNMSCLTSLTFNVERLLKKGFSGFIHQLGKHNRTLESLTICCTNIVSFDDEVLRNLSAGLAKWFCNIKRLSLWFRNNQHISEEGFCFFLKTVGRHLPRLQHLQMDLGRCMFATNRCIQTLQVQIASRLRNLESLALGFHWCSEIYDQSIQKISSEMLNTLSNLREFTFWITIFKITAAGLKTLVDGICHHLSNLERLELRIFESSYALHQKTPNLTDDITEGIIAQFSRSLKKLQKLSLTFDLCDGITDKGMKAIGTNIARDINSLQELRLFFNGCPNITNMGLDLLVSELCSNPTQLQVLELIFKEPSKINQQRLDSIAIKMADNLRGLRWLNFDLSGCKYVPEEARMRMKQILLKIPRVHIN